MQEEWNCSSYFVEMHIYNLRRSCFGGSIERVKYYIFYHSTSPEYVIPSYLQPSGWGTHLLIQSPHCLSWDPGGTRKEWTIFKLFITINKYVVLVQLKKTRAVVVWFYLCKQIYLVSCSIMIQKIKWVWKDRRQYCSLPCLRLSRMMERWNYAFIVTLQTVVQWQ